MQLETVEQAIEGYRYVQRTRAKVGPIRDILVRMESIIGSECYNANIQNYSAWGVWEGEGRSFRYPVTYIREGKEEKRKARVDDLRSEEHTSEIQSLMRSSYAVFCLKKTTA